jgi:hypothetical protein
MSVIGNKVVTPSPVRLSYVNLFEASKMKVNGVEQPGDPKYRVQLMIPKSDTVLVDEIKEALTNAYMEAKAARWGGKIPFIEEKKKGLRDGDVEHPDKPEYAGYYFISCSNKMEPGLLSNFTDANGKRLKITDPVDLYSGCWAYVSISFYGYSNVSVGISTTIHNVLKYPGAPKGFTDEKLAGGASAEEDFKDFATAEPTDDLPF